MRGSAIPVSGIISRHRSNSSTDVGSGPKNFAAGRDAAWLLLAIFELKLVILSWSSAAILFPRFAPTLGLTIPPPLLALADEVLE